MAHLESSPEVAKRKQDWSCGQKKAGRGRWEGTTGPDGGGILCATGHPALKVRMGGSVSMLESTLWWLCARRVKQPRRPTPQLQC